VSTMWCAVVVCSWCMVLRFCDVGGVPPPTLIRYGWVFVLCPVWFCVVWVGQFGLQVCVVRELCVSWSVFISGECSL